MKTNRGDVSRSDKHIDGLPRVYRSMACHSLVSRAIWLDSITQDVVPHCSTKDNCQNQVCIVRHKHKHQEERQAHASSIQYGTHGTIERGHSESLFPRDPQSIQQACLLSTVTMTFRRAVPTRSKWRPTPVPSPQFHTDALIEVPGEDTEVLIEHA